MMNKKAQADSYQLGERLGYYVLAIIMLTILFFFFAIIAKGVELRYYKSNYGVNTMNVEERFFDCVSYKDKVTELEYPKIIVKNLVDDEDALNKCMGINERASYNGIKANLYDANDNLLATGKTKNYVDRPDFSKLYPVMIYINDYEFGYINLSYWKT